jgi:pilus assembly protein CpaB
VNQSRAFLFSFFFALMGALMVYVYVDQQESAIKEEYGTEIVVWVAKENIPEMEIVNEQRVTQKSIPAKLAQPGHIKVEKDKPSPFLSGPVALAAIQEGEQILNTKVTPKGQETGLASQVAISRRAIAVPVNDYTGVGKLIKPGDRVDLLATFPPTDQGEVPETKTVLQNVHILAVGERIQNQLPSVFELDPVTGANRNVNLRGNRNFSTVTIEVTPLEAQAVLSTVSGAGAEFFLTLRNPVDRVTTSIPTTTVADVLGPNSQRAKKLIKAPPPAPAPASVTPPPPPPKAPPPNPWQSGGGSLVN